MYSQFKQIVMASLETRTPKVVIDEETHGMAVGNVDGKPVLFTGHMDRTLRLLDLTTVRPLHRPGTGHVGVISRIATAETGNGLLVVSTDYQGKIMAWNITGNNMVGKALGGTAGGFGNQIMAGSLKGKPIAMTFSAERANVWDVDSGRPMRVDIEFPGAGDSVLGQVGSKTIVFRPGFDEVRAWTLS